MGAEDMVDADDVEGADGVAGLEDVEVRLEDEDVDLVGKDEWDVVEVVAAVVGEVLLDTEFGDQLCKSL